MALSAIPPAEAMVPVLSLFIIVMASLLITRVGTVMLTLTGLSRESARFQARSAFSGAGFTTSEAEAVVNHPVRRRIILTLILLGNAGIVTGLVSLLLSFSNLDSSREALLRTLFIVLGIAVLWWIASTRTADRVLSNLIERALRRFTDIDVTDYAGLLRLTNDWVVGELQVDAEDWLCEAALADLDLPEEGVLVLGIARQDGRWLGAPKGTATLHAGDTAIIYGMRDTLARLDTRRRDPEGELDRVASQVDFTEEFLHQQDEERADDDQADDDQADDEQADDEQADDEQADDEQADDDRATAGEH